MMQKGAELQVSPSNKIVKLRPWPEINPPPSHLRNAPEFWKMVKNVLNQLAKVKYLLAKKIFDQKAVMECNYNTSNGKENLVKYL